MKHIIIICLREHQLFSGSVNFLKNIFAKDFKIDVVTHNVNISYLEALVEQNPTSVFVLFQMEYLAPWLTSKGMRVAVFPMYDGCGNAWKSYFQILDKTYLFNFSKKLHHICIGAGLVSYQLSYYPEIPDLERPKQSNRLFYWLRRPKSSLAEEIITDLFAPYVDKIHIHDRQDGYDINNDIFRIPDEFVSTSIWFDSKQELRELVSSSKYYLAPREAEGIGLAFLEAMGVGCIVFANRHTTHDEYIYHGHNGFLIDFQTRDEKLIKKQVKEAFEIIEARRKNIGLNAMNSIKEGRTLWEQQTEKVLQVMHTIHDANNLERSNRMEQFLGKLLIRLYQKDFKLYSIFTSIFIQLGFFTDRPIQIKIRSLFSILIRTIKFLLR